MSLNIRTLIVLCLTLLVMLFVAIAAQVAQYLTSTQAAREHALVVYLEHAALSDQARIQTQQAIELCELGLPINAEVKTTQIPTDVPVGLYECLNKRGFQDVSAVIKRSDEAMFQVTWPLSLFW
ncbi:TPA: hypothetical protein RTK63_005156 [Vibrio harveyi]|nr:hypothetical protein [Vibrio harveyi]